MIKFAHSIAAKRAPPPPPPAAEPEQDHGNYHECDKDTYTTTGLSHTSQDEAPPSVSSLECVDSFGHLLLLQDEKDHALLPENLAPSNERRRELTFDCTLSFFDDSYQKRYGQEEDDDDDDDEALQEERPPVDKSITVHSLCKPGGVCHRMLPEEWKTMKKMILFTVVIMCQKGMPPEGCFDFTTTMKTDRIAMQIHRKVSVKHTSSWWTIRFQSCTNYRKARPAQAPRRASLCGGPKQTLPPQKQGRACKANVSKSTAPPARRMQRRRSLSDLMKRPPLHPQPQRSKRDLTAAHSPSCLQVF
mmetsp:Transcript_33539/g.77327  ORF Transcript_33539/g.77327 Transcript_33539/m.77327 type:complete len:303 (+) Transcript_33539:117-1025(+)|eukprot:CAMPEP_0116842994 /NCGR_PEP_ID=MMETSP0418-20121206/11835_1 /TAXON_ID=1158023 /ORGANISM="Astrosyne radiata, Strain 13vi08-1A" /LENGTH=302 /DNA_ID=CAMNT_0004473685 /DNA_START=95 /DNA_END=1003 /DNA_ORIENTATION=+